MILKGDPWFIAQDVCQCLGLTHTATSVAHLDSAEKMWLAKANVSTTHFSVSNRGVTVISESGLYKLVLKSRRPEAKKFQAWVTQVVLPSIRKNGAYVLDQEKGPDEGF